MNEEEIKKLLLAPPREELRPTPSFDDITTIAEIRRAAIRRKTPIVSIIMETKEGEPLGCIFMIEADGIPTDIYKDIKAFIRKKVTPYLKKGEENA